jgi:hypothetical protein
VGINRAANIVILSMAILVFVSFFMFFYPGLAADERNDLLVLGAAFLAPAIAVANYLMGKSRYFNLAAGISCILISVLGAYAFKAGGLKEIVSGKNMVAGLWIVLSGYLVIGVCGLINSFRGDS